MRLRYILCGLVLGVLLILSGTVIAQSEPETRISLRADQISLQTGQTYSITVELSDVSELWLADLEIAYDPEHLFIIGTRSGSPMIAGDLMPSDQSINVFNRVAGDRIQLTRSLLAPAEPFTGSGILATFEVYPLQSGLTELRFTRADLRRVEFTTDEEGQRIGGDSESLPVVPVLLQLDIAGDTVEPPPEATATLTPTATPDPALIVEATPELTPSPTELVNVTAVPITPTPLSLIPDLPPDESPAIPPLALIAVGLLAFGLFGLLLLFVLSRRR